MVENLCLSTTSIVSSLAVGTWTVEFQLISYVHLIKSITLPPVALVFWTCEKKRNADINREHDHHLIDPGLHILFVSAHRVGEFRHLKLNTIRFRVPDIVRRTRGSTICLTVETLKWIDERKELKSNCEAKSSCLSVSP